MTAIEFRSKGASYKLIEFKRLSIMIFCYGVQILGKNVVLSKCTHIFINENVLTWKRLQTVPKMPF